MGKNLWPGLFIRPEINKKEMSLEIVNQIMVTRGMILKSPGTMLFSMKSLMSKDSIVYKALSEGPFKTKALTPTYPWLDSEIPASPILNVDKHDNELKINWETAGEEKPFWFVLYTRLNGVWTYEILPGSTLTVIKDLNVKNISAVAISLVDRCGNESEKSMFDIKILPDPD